ncbi:MAG: putative selenate ABC transporter substrate-binding protein [Proteobacteria bacterium]|nr:putative selenate ABC transporter substrate-binding protein [Pseudomonadota bacterium]MCP4921525.1 putative selenate ABC transporter substrate-binding protein [Pseudomonadota bacterium]
MLVLLLACTGEPPEASPVLSFSAIPDHDTTLLQQKYDPVAEHLSTALGVQVEYVPAADYSASVEMFKNGDVQLAWFGGLTGVQARAAVDGAHAIVQGAEDPEYFSYFIANAETGLELSEEFPTALADLSFTFGSPSSTSGRLMPEHFIRESTGKGPDEFFAQTYGFSGAHDKTAKLVEAGQVQAGALSYTTWDRLVADGTIDTAKAHVVWKTPVYADYNFTAHPDLETRFGPGFTDRLQAALIAIDDPALLAAFSRSALITAQDQDFARIEGVARDLGMLR